MADRRHWPTLLTAATIVCASGIVVGTPLAAPAAVTTAVVVVAAATTFVIGAVRHARLAGRLRAGSAAGQVANVRVRLGKHDRSAFVAGLSRPEIFCDRALLDDLTTDELHAVVLHERAHQLARDPLRMVAAATIAPLMSHLAVGRDWLSRHAARREIAADTFALTSGASRAAIASALLKVGPARAVHASGFTPAVDARLLALLGDEPPVHHRPPRWPAVVGGAALGTILCLVMLHPLFAAADMLTVCCP